MSMETSQETPEVVVVHKKTPSSPNLMILGAQDQNLEKLVKFSRYEKIKILISSN